MPAKKNKRGFLSEAERNYVERHRDRKSAEQIASHLRRGVGMIQRELDRLAGEPAKKQLTVADEIELRPEWAQWAESFTADELAYFKYKYMHLMGQFGRDDVLPTEEMQIVHVVTLDIMNQRALKEQKGATLMMDECSRRIESIREDFSREGDPEILAEVAAAEATFAEARRTVKECAARHEGYLMRQSAMLKELKATRDQRVKVIENSRQSFLGLLKALQQEEFREQEGMQAELMRVAVAKEHGRLAAPRQFADGQVDQPMLTPETVIGDEE